MTPKELDKLLRLGEGFGCEFKSSPSHLGREICAFANAAGGRILVGVNDQGQKIGLRNLNRTKSQIQTTARNIDPPLVVDIEEVEEILIVTVPSGPNKPYCANGIFYMREVTNTQQMKREEIREFFFKEGLILFDEQPCSSFDIRRDLDPEKYSAFVRMAGIPQTMRRMDVLRNLLVLKENGMANAGALLFSKRVSRFFLQASLTCVVFQGTTKVKILDQSTFQGSVVENYNNGISYLLSHLNTEYIIKGGPRREVLELPEEALRESLINALVHRDYRATAYIQIHIFHDRLEIINPGGLVPGVTLKELGRISRPRNPLLFALLHRMELVEHIGSGIKRIKESMRDYRLSPPKIEAGADWFSITFKRKPQHEAVVENGVTPSREGVSEGVNEGVSEGVKQLYQFILNNPGKRTPELSLKLDVPIKTLERWLQQLRELGEVEFRGSPRKGGYWPTGRG
ncbi:MAG: ATP-binding protein [Candidatus Auribacterota bacterium]|nr:ATP-binding protein [Candidatus Auribacterota bacterium]